MSNWHIGSNTPRRVAASFAAPHPRHTARCSVAATARYYATAAAVPARHREGRDLADGHRADEASKRHHCAARCHVRQAGIQPLPPQRWSIDGANAYSTTLNASHHCRPHIARSRSLSSSRAKNPGSISVLRNSAAPFVPAAQKPPADQVNSPASRFLYLNRTRGASNIPPITQPRSLMARRPKPSF
jgi:hypothetical protein